MQRRRYVRRSQVMEQDHRRRLEKADRRQRVVLWRVAVVIAVDKRERPTLAALAEPDHFGGAEAWDEDRAASAADRGDRGRKFTIPIGIGELRLDDMQRRQPGGEEMTARPASPRADLQAAPASEELCIRVENGGLVRVDEADLGIASVDVPSVLDLSPEIGPGRAFLVPGDHIGEVSGKIRSSEVFRYVI